nr:hypothetical protein OH837_49140 [Streptomyces canus]
MTARAPLAAHCKCGADGVRNANGWTRFLNTDDSIEDICPLCWEELQRVLTERREQRYRKEQEHRRSWRAKYAEVADCASCGKKDLRVRLPRDGRYVGDGTMYITYWHKSAKTGRDCRSEVDAEDVRVVERATRGRTRKNPPIEGERVT